MSGMFGILDKRGAPVEARELDAMQHPMAFWGPDRYGAWCHGTIGLGHVRLDETPESLHDVQPRSDPSGSGIVLVADARIDNRDELGEALDLDVSAGSMLADSELILSAWRRWGAASVDRLHGAFAFVIWDARRQELSCVRDHVGLRPFQYYDDEKRFVFATDVRAVLAVKGVPHQLDEEALDAYYLENRSSLLDRSFLRGIRKLRPGHLLTIHGDGSTRQQRWWTPGARSTIRLKSNDDYAALVLENLEQAVACRLRTQHPVGAHLSGGLDSSIVTVLAARQLQATGRALAKTYSWLPPPSEGSDTLESERSLIHMVCDQEGLECTNTPFGTEDAIADMTHDFTLEPSDSQVYERIVCGQAAADGVRVLLSGWGGDEVATCHGRGYFAEQFLRGHWLRLLLESWRHLAHRGRVTPTRLGIHLLHRVIKPLLPDAVFKSLGRDSFPVQRLLIRTYEQQSGVVRPAWQGIAQDDWRRSRERPSVQQVQLASLANGHLTFRLEAWAQLAAQHGATYRYPLLDRRVLECGLALPASMHRQQGYGRFAVRLAAAGILPDAVRWADKQTEAARVDAYWEAVEAALVRLDERKHAAVGPAWRLAERSWIYHDAVLRHLGSGSLRRYNTRPCRRGR